METLSVIDYSVKNFDDKIKFFISCSTLIFDSHAPANHISSKTFKHENKPFITYNIKKYLKRKILHKRNIYVLEQQQVENFISN